MASVEYLLSQYVRALIDGSAAVFVGAGLSVPGGFSSWKELLRDVASQLRLDVDQEHDLLAVAQYCVNENAGRGQINELLLREFTRRARPTPNHDLLAKLPLQRIWTTNYDTLLEEALQRQKKRFEKKVTSEDLTSTLPGRATTVFKMHGDISAPHRTILTRDDYENYERTHPLFIDLLRGDLASKTFLFLGFSFSDPNIDYVLGRLRVLLGQNRRDHFYITRCFTLADFKNHPGSEADKRAKFRYERHKQQLRINDLKRYGIQTVLVDDYAGITLILEEISRRYARKSILISGSATIFEPLTQSYVEDICRMLGERLIATGLRLLSGTGLGIGSAVVTGAMTEIYKEQTEIGDRLMLVHFPQDIPAAQRKLAYEQYRQELVSKAGYTVFICGNKVGADGSIQNAEGVQKEFELTQSFRHFPIPIGCSGHVAQDIWKKVNADLAGFFPGYDVASFFQVLNDKNAGPQGIVNAVMDIIRVTQRPPTRPWSVLTDDPECLSVAAMKQQPETNSHGAP
ncbi:hypothetical protein FJV41_02465 [Myxococcus llanfairpwllgwyngyllgogerychwyrndrobwllllantysiliogogogochensis]|uniref:NAD(+) hydrolase ThsA n=1 Tax=Myxococcus llanfairpwllgwyngyllgogerychwyrndrobwllllantysiliogogogochensis TaxID=2590453 RepID=A0A540X8D5_9BACT|nr:SIR2 family protein [Myxococcus llanfairpwllgwyngyllgogerychwyrndrobwllllantysiliogogogochensis]TQF17492.1 hypothetical protein FJV41_02465 [Myxococcus llanfairpwllgwyngyllgogerychwyrndrobwllllantysiliogogogochensis]